MEKRELIRQNSIADNFALREHLHAGFASKTNTQSNTSSYSRRADKASTQISTQISKQI